MVITAAIIIGYVAFLVAWATLFGPDTPEQREEDYDALMEYLRR